MTLTLRHSAAVLLGIGFSLLPAFAPFVAILFSLQARWAFTRLDGLALVGALLYALPMALAGDAATAALGFLQLIAAWLLLRSFQRLGQVRRWGLDPTLVGTGLIAGLALMVGLSWWQIDRVDLLARPSQVIVWRDSPALYGHTVLVLGMAIAILAPNRTFRMASLFLSALGILVSGSREAAVAWVFVAVALMVLAPLRPLRRQLAETLLVGLMLVLASGVGSTMGWSRLGFLLDLAPATSSVNLLQGTEIDNGHWWFARGVETETGAVELAGETLTSYTVTKRDPEQWRRLQQVARLQPGEPYTVSAWIRVPADAAEPGIQGWGELTDQREAFTATGRLRGDEWAVSLSGPGRLLSSGVLTESDEWRRVWFTFVYEGADTLHWWLGLAPDQRHVAGTSSTFAGFQLERADALGPYVPGSASQGLGLHVARTPYWWAAWDAVRERPLLGWGATGFDEYYRTHSSNRGQAEEVPAHTHNLPLQVLFERGVVGLAGLALFIAALAGNALRRRDLLFLAVLAGVLVANWFDYTLFYGGVLYPLVAAAGWRAAVARGARAEADEDARQAAARLTLAAVDFLMAMLALASAERILAAFGGAEAGAPWPPVLYYALLLWPAASWREGLYPGYGLTAPQELKKQFAAAAFAGLIFAAGSVLFPAELSADRSLLLLTIALTFGTLPIGRALAKRLLHRLGLWGRPVVILGAGATGRRIARSLRRNPLDGLVPVALFDDDPAKHGRELDGLRVKGPLSEAEAYARRGGIVHAIVAIPTLPRATLAGLIDRSGRTFKRIQFVPELNGLPAEDVFASNLDGMLALEVRNGLYSKRNQFVKRVIDLVGATMVTALTFPVLVGIYVLVRLDSRGPGFYASERAGQDGRPFHCLKFRTMHVDAEAKLQELIATDPRIAEEYARYHKLEDDPRVTRAGRLLRRYSLDELPQLVNVFRGEMSLVGPRPYLTREIPVMGEFGEVIFQAKPGITGLWQVSGRNELSFRERNELEAHYVRNWSIWWDMIVLVKTFGAVLGKRGAR